MKFVNLSKFSIIVAITILAFSCSKDSPPEIVAIAGSENIFSEEGISFTDNSTSKIVHFSVNKDWNISVSNSEWCRVTPTSGLAGDVSLKIVISQNETYDSRTSNISINAEDLVKKIKISQAQKDALIFDEAQKKVDEEANSFELKFDANVEYEYSIPEEAESWVQISDTKSKGLIENTLTFTVSENTEVLSRNCEVKFTYGDKSKIFTLIQGGIIDKFVMPKININDFNEIINDLEYFSDNITVEKIEDDIIIEADITKNKDKSLFSQITYTFKNEGEDGFLFDFEFNSDKEISSKYKESVYLYYDQVENMHKVEKLVGFTE